VRQPSRPLSDSFPPPAQPRLPASWPGAVPVPTWRTGPSPSSDGGSESVVQHGLEEKAALGLGDPYLRFEAVADGHELVDLGDDAALLDDGLLGQTSAARCSSTQPRR